jgi:hypothetical protein
MDILIALLSIVKVDILLAAINCLGKSSRDVRQSDEFWMTKSALVPKRSSAKAASNYFADFELKLDHKSRLSDLDHQS